MPLLLSLLLCILYFLRNFAFYLSTYWRIFHTMDNYFDFSAFRTLKPLGMRQDDNSTHDIVFCITFNSDGEPWLSVRGDVPENASGHVGELLREIQRVGSDGFNIGWGDQSKLEEVSLWKNPYLVPMLKVCSGVVDADGAPIVFSDSAASLSLVLSDVSNSMVAPQLAIRHSEGSIYDVKVLSGSYFMAGSVVYTTENVGDNFALLPRLMQPFYQNMIEQYLSVFLSYIDNVIPEYRGNVARYSSATEDAVPTIVLEKVAADQALYMRVTQTMGNDSDTTEMPLPLTRAASVDITSGTIAVRSIRQVDLSEAIARLKKMIEHSAPNRQALKDVYHEKDFFIIPPETASPFLFNYLPQILQEYKLLGSDKLKEYKVTAARPKLSVRLSSGIDYLEGDADIEVAGETFTLNDLLKQFNKNRYVQLSDGNRAVVDDRYIKRLQRLFNNRDKDGRVKVSIFDLPQVEEMIQAKVTGKLAVRSREIFQGFNSLPSEAAPQLNVDATLRPYQVEGVKWIKYLHDNNIGGCLADDMGLGKTLQTISMLSTLYPGTEAPSLIIMPRSLLFNWQNELNKFAPQLTVSTYYGTDRNLEEALKAQIILTTYAMVRNDIEKLKDIAFHYIVLDESQNIKNLNSQTSIAVTLMQGAHKLALSGTPMENNLTELYSLFRFLNPTMFGTAEEFNNVYTYPIQRNGDNDAMQSLRRKIFPFMLRRLKKEVLDELPDRIEQVLYVEMNEQQKELYNRRRAFFKQQINDTIAREGVQKSQFVMFQALGELRRIASIPESLTDGTIASPKISRLLELVTESVDSGHKTVVFFNFIAGIELAGAGLQRAGIEFETMTGSTSATQRKRIVERFQTDPRCMVLMMTLKVGGVGLNLTAADTVFILEPWWNKAAEEQAINRLHRIGQKNTVNAYSIICEETIEEKILQLQEQKKELFDGLISSDSASAKHLSEEDINFILS